MLEESDPLGLEVIGGCESPSMDAELWSSMRTVQTLNQGAFSPEPGLLVNLPNEESELHSVPQSSVLSRPFKACMQKIRY